MRFKRPVLIFICCATAVAVLADGESNAVALSETPAAVQKTIQAQVGDGKLGGINKTTNEWETVYEVELTGKDGAARDLAVAEDGTLLSVEVTLAETPAAVRQTIERQVGQGTLGSIDKAFDDGEISYDVEMTTKDGADRSFTVAADGKLQRIQVTLEEVPAAVRKTIKDQVGRAKLGDILRTFDDGEIFYDVEISRDGKERDYSVAEDGRLESREVFLSELPPQARKTVKEKIGEGKILRIDEVFVKRQGVFPYEVEGRKGGKPFNFSVGPKGRFFGMDD